MKIIRLIRKMNQEEIFIFILSVLLTSSIVYVMAFQIEHIKDAKYIAEETRNTIKWFWFAPDNELEETKYREINEFLDRSNLLEFAESPSEYITTEGNGIFLITSPNMYEKVINEKLKEGKGFDGNVNEAIVLSQNAKKNKVGDEIQIDSQNTVMIQGIAHSSEYISADYGEGLDENSRYSALIDRFEESGENFYLLHYSHPLALEMNKNRLKNCFAFKSSVNEKEKNLFTEELKKYGKVLNVQKMQEDYVNEETSFLNETSIVLMGCLFVLLLCGLVANNILRLLNKKKEYGIYYLCGLQWWQSIAISIGKNLVPYSLGIILGEISLYFKYGKLKEEGRELFHYNTYEMIKIAMFCIVVYFIVSLPVFIKFKKLDPIEMIREE